MAKSDTTTTTNAFTSFERQIDMRSVVDRIADVLAESNREDTTVEFRLGLLQGALQVAMPHLAHIDMRYESNRKVMAERKARYRERVRSRV